MFCKNCGKEILPTQRFCGVCGAANDSADVNQAATEKPLENIETKAEISKECDNQVQSSAESAPQAQPQAPEKKTPAAFVSKVVGNSSKSPAEILLIVSAAAFLFLYIMWFIPIAGSYKSNLFSFALYSQNLIEAGYLLFTIPVGFLTVAAAYECFCVLKSSSAGSPNLILSKMASIAYTGCAFILALIVADEFKIDITFGGVFLLLVSGGLIALSFIIPNMIKKQKK